MQKNIVHLDLDTFFVSVERLINTKLIGKPVIIGGTSDRGVVASCSYESRQFGIHAAMPMKMARILCPEAILVRGDMETYSKYSNMVSDIIAEKSPLYEKASIDEHYIDITGMDRFFGTLKWSKELRHKIISETGLPISFGLSTNKTVSKIATGESKPNGELEVQQNDIKPFLTPLSIQKIPGVGDKTFRLLRTMGIDTIGTLSHIPPDVMLRVLGKNGQELWKKANGIDLTPVKSFTKQKSMSTERTFEQDTIDIIFLNQKLVAMVEKLSYELRKSGKVTACIAVKVRYSNFDTHTQQRKIAYTSLDYQILEIVKDLFGKVFNRRMRLRLIGIRFSQLIHGSQQLSLFDDTSKMANLYMAWDKMRNRYGSNALKSGITIK